MRHLAGDGGGVRGIRPLEAASIVNEPACARTKLRETVMWASRK